MTDRDPRGRFQPGCTPGPGRPRKKTPPPTPELDEGPAVTIAAIARRDAEEAWRYVIAQNGPDSARQLAQEIKAIGRWIPDWPELQPQTE